MATTILTKRSNTASAVPLSADLTNSSSGAELAVNTADKRLFTKDSGGTVVELGINPSSLTLSGGTANGVTYLNGSKVLTSGSALTFDGTSLKVGTTGATNYRLLVSRGGTAGEMAQFTDGTAQTLTIDSAASSILINSANGGALAFGVTSEQMRLTSTGLGIGTSSPSYKLDIAGATYARLTTTTYSNGGFINARTSLSGGSYNTFDFVEGSTTTAYLRNYGSIYGSSVDSHLRLWNTQSAPITFGTSDTERMRLDSSGNLGLGVTPSAWDSGQKAIQTGTAAFYGYTGGATMAQNAYYNSGWKYIGTGTAAYYGQVGAAHQWFTAGSGTAGNAITFTQAMTLDASGNLAIGRTAATTRLHLKAASDAADVLQIQNSSETQQLYLGVSASGPYIFAAQSTNLRFGTANTEVARIDSSGNLLVNQSSLNGAGKVEIAYDRAGSWGMQIRNTTGTTAATTYIAFKYVNTQTGYIESTGSTTSYVTTSDYRLKENVQPMTCALAKVAALKPCTYKWKVDGSDGEGFIAHELAEVCPSAVSGEKDAVNEDGSIKPQGIDTSFLVATLTAAIQELKAEFDAYKASHP